MRACSGFFTAARQLQALTGGAPGDALQPSNPLYRLERALGTAMHHDAVTGTERQHVAYDYALQLGAGTWGRGDVGGWGGRGTTLGAAASVL